MWVFWGTGGEHNGPPNRGEHDSFAKLLGLPDLRRQAAEETYDAGTVIFVPGEPPRKIYMVVSGMVALSREELGRKVAVQLLHAGEAFGDVALLARAPQRFEARALGKTKVLSVASAEVARLLRRPEVAVWWLESIAQRLLGLRERFAATLAGEIDERLALFLLGEAADGEVCAPQSALAQLFGVHRSSINRALKELEAAGLVQVGYSRIRVVDAEGLGRRVGKRADPEPRTGTPSGSGRVGS